jgi:prolyl-tRNA editing enzyme YbaK/EbsC (Cys-tRNA(Pro) deacylase)
MLHFWPRPLSGAPKEERVRSCSDVHNFLCEEDVPHEILHLPSPADTARRAAESLGVPLGEVVKTLLFFLDAVPTLILVPGDAVAGSELISAASGCTEVVLARPHEVLRLTGYRAGALPPCGLATSLSAFADPQVFTPPVVYCGGGTTTTMLKLRSGDLRRVVAAHVAPVGHWPQWGAAAGAPPVVAERGREARSSG